MPSRSVVALLALATVLVVAAPAAGLGSSGVVPADGTAPHQPDAGVSPALGSAAQENETLPPSEVTYRLQLQPDGDARWTIAMTLPIRNENESRAFDEQAAAFEESESPLGLDSYRTYASAASDATGREMELRNVETSTDRENGTGTLAVSFTWSNFARVDGDRLFVGDAFNTTNGTWFESIPEHHRLIIAPPDGYGVSDAPQVGFDDGAAWWRGPYTFDGREPWVVYSGDAPTQTTVPGTTSPASPGSEPPSTGTRTDAPEDPFSSALPLVLIVVVAGISAAAVAHYVRSDDGDSGETGATPGDGSGGSAGAGAAATDGSADATGASTPGSSADESGTASASSGGETADADDVVPPGAGSAGASGAGAAMAAGEDGGNEVAGEDGVDEAGAGVDDGAATDDVDEALLSDEERVERLLERNGGRMKQASIVKETGWSNAKVSQLLSAMAEDDRIDKLRIGRENLISFPDEDVTDIDSE